MLDYSCMIFLFLFRKRVIWWSKISYLLKIISQFKKPRKQQVNIIIPPQLTKWSKEVTDRGKWF